MTELIPPDLEQCQADKPNNYTFMTLGGVPGLVRCTAKSTLIATENQPGEDGLIGSMSLCDDCAKVFIQQLGPRHATFVPISVASQDDSSTGTDAE